MRWPKDPSGDGRPKINRIYRIMRRFSRAIVSIWFREINIVDDENIPPEGGVIFISWHPSGLIDPMLMHASLPGKLSMIAKHTLFNVPILGRLIRGAGAVPILKIRPTKKALNIEIVSNSTVWPRWLLMVDD